MGYRSWSQTTYLYIIFFSTWRPTTGFCLAPLSTNPSCLPVSLPLSISLVVVSLAFCRTHNGQSLMKTTVSSSRQMYGGYFAWPTLGGGAISIFQLVDTFISLSIGLTSRGTRRL